MAAADITAQNNQYHQYHHTARLQLLKYLQYYCIFQYIRKLLALTRAARTSTTLQPCNLENIRLVLTAYFQPMPAWMFVLRVSTGQVNRWQQRPAIAPAFIKIQELPSYRFYLVQNLTMPSQVPQQHIEPQIYLSMVTRNPRQMLLMPLALISLNSRVRELWLVLPSCLCILVYSTGQQMKETAAPTIPPAAVIYHSFSLSGLYSCDLWPQWLQMYRLAHSQTRNSVPMVKANPKSRLDEPLQKPFSPYCWQMSCVICGMEGGACVAVCILTLTKSKGWPMMTCVQPAQSPHTKSVIFMQLQIQINWCSYYRVPSILIIMGKCYVGDYTHKNSDFRGRTGGQGGYVVYMQWTGWTIWIA